ncbi:uncharacterized protein METZ01_LOCUS172399 [marine metagenome]|uniref:Uncharacterized protein n=1 Tax=marine metagenome TaxID=408172 RepID=A0A382C0C7_9ZZZZ
MVRRGAADRGELIPSVQSAWWTTGPAR